MNHRAVLIGGLSALLALCACKPRTASPSAPATVAESGPAPLAAQRSESCAVCHADIAKAWKDTDHALANSLPDDAHRAALASFPGGAPRDAEGLRLMILGHKPIWQPLVPTKDGRWQAHEMAYDPKRGDWFNVFGKEDRHAGEWGHWTGRGMNWNSMCAQCHMTGYQPGYDFATDSYHPKWIEQGIGCVQCHGEAPASHVKPGAYDASRNDYDTYHNDRSLAMQACATCHARQESLTGTFKPGDNYDDHYRITLPVDPAIFYPDGQQRDEDFNWTSVQLSRMGHAGVTCMDCHDPHTSKTILPVENNALCMQCHSAPGRVMTGGARAVPIDPLAHSHHSEGSVGNQCVSCHMPTTTYMQRSPRHDHGWLKPDPLLTKELGIPNACSRCHEKEGIDWVIEKANAWYGEKLDSRQRARARSVVAAQRGDDGYEERLLALLAGEDVPAWRATYIDLLSPAVERPDVRTAAEQSLKAGSPLERAAAVRALTPLPDTAAALRPLLNDPVRLVRIDAAWALPTELPPGSSIAREFQTYIDIARDQPAGLARIGMVEANRGQLAQAVTTLKRAGSWDSGSSGIQESLAQVLVGMQKPAEAAAAYERAAQLDERNVDAAYRAALAYVEAGLMTEAETNLRLTLKRAPEFDRAWYNLGLMLAAKNDLPGGIEALKQASKLNPQVPDYPYAAATLHLRAGDREAAKAAAGRALVINPNYTPARRLIDGL